jgi:hypothetical protein
MTHVVYCPILKGKEGEFTALQALSTSVQDAILPLIEIPRIPYDYVNEQELRNVEEHVKGITERLKECWRDRPVYVDVPWFDDADDQEDAALAVMELLPACQALQVEVVPVVATTKSVRYLAAVNDYVRRVGSGLCVRLTLADFEEENEQDPAVAIDALLGRFRLPDNQRPDLLLDLGDLGSDLGRATLLARSVIASTPSSDLWRRFILAGASFPENLSDVNASTTTTLPRVEWDLWERLRRRRGSLRPDAIFGDYAITNPVVTELDPRMMRMSASIRYTTSQEWLVVKGRNVRQYGFDQYYELARLLVDLPQFAGEEFCWGDRFIARCARGETGPGNATTWRKVGTNHHITLVVRELANHRDA